MTHAEQTRVEALSAHKQTDYEPVINTVIDLTAEPLFLEEGYAKGVDPSDTDSEAYKQHLQDYASEYCQALAGVETEESLTALALFASAPLAHHKKAELNLNKTKHHLSNKEFHGAKDTLVQFNFLLAKYIEQHPAENAAMLVNGLSEITARFSEVRDYSIHNEYDRLVQGIRTEFGFAQVVNQIKGISLRHADAAQERKGIDFVLDVPLPGRTTPTEVDIDIKSSLDQVAGTAGGYNDTPYAKDRYGHFKYYPLLPKEAYENGSFLVKQAYADQVSSHIGMHLFMMAKSV